MIERLLQAIELTGVPKRGMASRIAERTGYSKGMVSMVLSEKELPSDKFLISVCRAFGINLEWLMSGEGNMFSQDMVRRSFSPGPVRLDIGRGKSLQMMHLVDKIAEHELDYSLLDEIKLYEENDVPEVVFERAGRDSIIRSIMEELLKMTKRQKAKVLEVCTEITEVGE